MVAIVTVHGENADVARVGALYRKLFDADLHSCIIDLISSCDSTW